MFVVSVLKLVHFINHAFSSSVVFGCVGRLCLLNVAIPDMHSSFIYLKFCFRFTYFVLFYPCQNILAFSVIVSVLTGGDNSRVTAHINMHYRL
jgi:hypothetical protein